MVEVKLESYNSKKPWQRKHINIKKETFRTPTFWLEDFFFKHEVSHDVSDFKDTKTSWLDMPLLIISMVQLQLQSNWINNRANVHGSNYLGGRHQ